MIRRIAAAFAIAAAPCAVFAQASPEALVDEVEARVIAWRRHIHQNPELSYQEVKTAAYIAEALRTMPGMEVRTGVAKTGIKAVLKGGRPGPVVALRADMDALPVEERNDLPFRSQAKAAGLTAEARVERGYPVLSNDPPLATRMLGSLERAAGRGRVVEIPPVLGAEDFGAYTQSAPGFFWFLNAPVQNDRSGAPNHSPLFMIGEQHLKTGVRALVWVALDYLRNPPAR
jgi:metal-dependent amidase/aminoacylase/carboxypeptidase family protein